jgi:TonB family protein
MSKKFHKKENAENALVDSQTRRKIFHTVVIAHVVVILLIVLWGVLVEFFKPKPPSVLTVSLYTPPQSSGAPPAYTPPRTEAPKKKTTKPKPKPKPKKRWKPAKKIKVSKKLVYVKPKKTAPQVKPIDKQKLLTAIKQKYTKIRSDIQSSGAAQNYENSVGAYLYQLWDTPDKSILGDKRPEVKIKLNIAANGQLLYAKILKPSGVTAMDKSVQELLKKVKYLPVPENGPREVILILEVIE